MGLRPANLAGRAPFTLIPAPPCKLAVTVAVFGWVIDLDGLAGRHGTRRQGCGLSHVLRLVQHHVVMMDPCHHVDAGYRLNTRYTDDAIDVLLVIRPIHVFVLGDVPHALHGFVLVGGIDFASRPIALGTVGPLRLSFGRGQSYAYRCEEARGTAQSFHRSRHRENLRTGFPFLRARGDFSEPGESEQSDDDLNHTSEHPDFASEKPQPARQPAAVSPHFLPSPAKLRGPCAVLTKRPSTPGEESTCVYVQRPLWRR